MSSSASASASSGGISMLGLLGVILVVAKVFGYINIPWIWALAPFWIPAAFGLLFLITMAAFAWWVSK